MTSIGSFAGLAFFAEAAEDEGSFNPILPTLPEIIWSSLFFFGPVSYTHLTLPTILLV